MKMTIESTSKIITFNDIKCRVWEGVSKNGVKVYCFIPRIAIHKDEPADKQAIFEKELEEQKPPSVEIECFPSRMII